jgi:hypothetical protein
MPPAETAPAPAYTGLNVPPQPNAYRTKAATGVGFVLVRSAMPILIRNPDGPYYSQGDERAFFEWAKRISCIEKLEGSGHELRIHVRRRRVSNTCLWELIGLFHRYDVAMDQLAQFESASNRAWFRSPKMFWYRAVFGKRSRKPPTRPTRKDARAAKR